MIIDAVVGGTHTDTSNYFPFQRYGAIYLYIDSGRWWSQCLLLACREKCPYPSSRGLRLEYHPSDMIPIVAVLYCCVN